MTQPAGKLSVPVDCLYGHLSIKAFQTQHLSAYQSYCASLAFSGEARLVSHLPNLCLSQGPDTHLCYHFCAVAAAAAAPGCAARLLSPALTITALCVVLDHLPTLDSCSAGTRSNFGTQTPSEAPTESASLHHFSNPFCFPESLFKPLLNLLAKATFQNRFSNSFSNPFSICF